MIKPEKKVSLKNYTTYKIGGDAEYFYQANTRQELMSAIQFALKEEMEINIIGGGSNVLISDKGVKGLTIKNNVKDINITNKEPNNFDIKKSFARYSQGEYMKFNDLEDDETKYEKILVEVQSGVNLTFFINQMINNGLTGIQYFSGIPGTIGGAVFNNIHGGTRIIGDLVYSAEVMDKEGNIIEVSPDFLKFGYDESILHTNQYFLISVKFVLFKGNQNIAKKIALEWTKRKKAVQPILPSAGSVFKNITEEERQAVGAPVNSSGWLIDQMGFKGFTIGGAKVYEKHANFIVNMGFAKQTDVSEIIEKIQESALEKYKLELIPEIIFKGEK